MQVGETSLWSKDVQRLLWAAGEARARTRRREHRRLVAGGRDAPADGDLSTEWQPTTG